MSRHYIYYVRDLLELAPNYDECPTICGETEEPCKKFCEFCPVKDIEDDFKSEAINELNERAKDWQKWGFENLMRNVQLAAHFYNSDKLNRSSWTLKTERIVNAYENEVNRVKRVDEWQANQRRQRIE